MKRTIAFLCVMGVFHCYSSQNISWNRERKLTWEDFKGTPNDARFAASTYCVIGMIPEHTNILNGQTSYKITCEFISDSSWYFKEKESLAVLLHEQLHFDIAELYARKMRQKLKKPIMPTVGRYIFNTLYDEYMEFQKLYESQTRYGAIKEEQSRWNALVKKRLKKLKKFEAE